jgi:hypothetical protein
MTRFGITALFNRRRVAVTWLAVLALLSHALVPAALMLAAGVLKPGVGSIRFALCSASPEHDNPGKAPPGLPTYHCALCTVSAADLCRPPTVLMPNIEIARTVYARLGTEWLVLPWRHGQVQARAPPVMA